MEYVFVKGKTKWFRNNVLNKFDKYSHQLYIEGEDLAKVQELKERGLKNDIKKDEDGWFVSFSRPPSILVRGKVVGLLPPEVFQADGKTPMRDQNIGNGSDVTTKLEVYSHRTPGGGKAVAARWLSSRIDNLISYQNERDQFEQEERASRGLPEQPPQPLF